jgi:hypothetical protein
MKTSELTGAALDWAVAKCEGLRFEEWETWGNYSTDWAQGGPIIEREGIALLPPELAEMPGYEGRGETLLIAAMRCYVTSKLGDEIEVPEDLNKEKA